MCDCIEVLNTRLAPDSYVRNLIEDGGKYRRALLQIRRSDNRQPEDRPGKLSVILAIFCPICGAKYPDPPDPAAQLKEVLDDYDLRAGKVRP